MSAYVSLPLYMNSIPARYSLVAKKCNECGLVNFPPRPKCLGCGDMDLVDEKLSGKGKVYTYSIIAKGGGPAEFDDQQNMTGAYSVIVAELDEGPRIIGQLVDVEPRPENIHIGMEVMAVIRRLYDQENVIRYSFKFKPVK